MLDFGLENAELYFILYLHFVRSAHGRKRLTFSRCTCRAILPTPNGFASEINTKGFIMDVKTLVPTVVLALALSAPALSFAQQSDAPLTRAQVRAQLVQLEKGGYQPAGGVGPYYPAHFQAVEARVAAQDRAAKTQP
jgi:hypothetical protein